MPHDTFATGRTTGDSTDARATRRLSTQTKAASRPSTLIAQEALLHVALLTVGYTVNRGLALFGGRDPLDDGAR